MVPPKKINRKTRETRKDPPKTRRLDTVAKPATTTEVDDADEIAAEVVDNTFKGSRGSGKLKDDDDYESDADGDATELEDTEVEGDASRLRGDSRRKKSSTQSVDDEAAKRWKARALKAERQLKVVSNTRVINAFQEGEVRQYAKQVLWKKVKFITCDETMVRCMKDAVKAFEIGATEQQDWMSTYSHCVREAINAQRNHCCQELRKTLLSKYSGWRQRGTVEAPITNSVLSVHTEMKAEQHVDYVDDVTNYLDVRAAKSDDEFSPFWTFFDKLVPCVAGVKIWSIKVKISDTVTGSNCVTVTDEAFTMLALENYWGRWFHAQPAKWTDSRRGNQQFMGWSDEAYTRYDDACRRIKKQRGTTASKTLEKLFKIQARDTYANGRVVSRTDTSREQQRMVFDELDIE
jgi:hypothetical protein